MKKSIIGIIIAIIVVPISVYAISPYFTESTIDEELPANVIRQSVPEDEMMMDEEGKMMMDEEGKMMMDEEGKMMMDEEGKMMMSEDEMRKMMDEGEMSEESNMMSDDETIEEVTRAVTSEEEEKEMAMEEKEMASEEDETVTADMAMEEVTKLYRGMFVGVGDGIHHAEGVAKVLPLDDGSEVLRLEDFFATNGPGLYVYLATDKSASDFVNLGELKANRGNQNYDIPDQTDLEKYNKVLIWCKPFSVLFGSAELTEQ